MGLVSLFFALSKADLGYLQWVRAFLRCSISFWSNWGLLHTVFALWVRVFITLYLAERWWWLPHCRYWSVWVHFLYTVIESYNGAAMPLVWQCCPRRGWPILIVIFHCKLNGWVNTINVLKEALFIFFPLDNPHVIHIPESYFGGWVAVFSTSCLKYST